MSAKDCSAGGPLVALRQVTRVKSGRGGAGPRELPDEIKPGPRRAEERLRGNTWASSGSSRDGFFAPSHGIYVAFAMGNAVVG